MTLPISAPGPESSAARSDEGVRAFSQFRVWRKLSRIPQKYRGA
jgi:hypothetical protein